MLEFDDVPAKRESETVPPKKRRGRLVAFLLVFLVLVPLVLLTLNGPGFRVLARYAGLKAAAAQGLGGDFTIRGNLWSGFTLKGVDFSGGDGETTSLQIEEMSVAYRGFDLIRNTREFNWLNSVRVQKARLDLYLPEWDEGGEEKNPWSRFPDPRPLWNLLAADIQIDDLTVFVHQGGSVLALEHVRLRSPVDGSGELRIERISLPGHAPLESVHVALRRDENELTLGPFPLLGFGTLENLTITVPAEGDWSMDALLGIGGGHVSASVNKQGEASLALRRGSQISLDKIGTPRLDGGDSSLRGLITELDLRFEGDIEDPSTWKGEGKLIASGTGWNDYRVDSLLLTLRENRLELDALRRRGSLRASASVPLGLASSTEELSALPLDLSIQLEVPSLAETLLDFGHPVSWEGAVSLEARDIQFKPDGALQAGSLLLLCDGLAWGGIPLAGGQLAANVVGENLVRVAAEIGPGTENQIRLTGEVDTGALRYEAEVTALLDHSSPILRILEERNVPVAVGAGKFDWSGSGDFRNRHHEGKADASVDSLFVLTGRESTGKLTARYEGSSAYLESFALQCDGAILSGTGSWDGKELSLPDWKLSVGDKVPLSLRLGVPLERQDEVGFLEQTGPVEIRLAAHRLALDEVTRFFSGSPPPGGFLDGELGGLGSFDEMRLDGNFAFHPEKPESDPDVDTPSPSGEEPKLVLNFGLAGKTTVPSSWDATLDASVSGMHWNGMALENIALEGASDPSRDGSPFVAMLRFDQSGTQLETTVRSDLGTADTLASLKALPWHVEADLAVTDFATLVSEFAPDSLKGLPLSGDFSATVRDLRLAGGSFARGSAILESDTFAIEGEGFERFNVRARVAEADQIELVADLALDEENRVKAEGGFHLMERTYQGNLALHADLRSGKSKLGKILKNRRKITSLLPAFAEVNWEGKGSFPDNDHEGALDLTADGLSLAEGSEAVDLRLEGSYTAASADFPTLRLTSRPFALAGALRWEGQDLRLLDWTGTSEGREVLTLSGSLPLDREKLAAAEWFGQDRPLDLALTLDKLPVETVSRLFRKDAPILGTLSAKLSAKGTPAAPAIAADLVLDRISVPGQASSIRTGRLELDLATSGEKAELEGRFEHPDINPLVIRAELPFHPGAWALGERSFAEETLSASARMEQSPLAFLASQVPGIESISGVIALDAEVKGSVSRPQLSGSGVLDVSRLRFKNRNAPSFYDVDLSARFADNRILLENLRAIVAGGTVQGRGEIVLEPGAEPRLDLSLVGSEVLVVRNPEVNVRSDLAIEIKGPWSQASLSGELGITNSRYFKNFDLLPIGLGSRGGSSLPTVGHTPRGGGPTYEDLNLGVKLAPFQDWSVDLRLHTKTPFLVRSNLVNSGVTADLKISGTLGRPLPRGYVAIEKGEMSLPFSKIDVETGRIEFDESTGFNGAIEFKARGRADRYQVNIYLFNRILSPQYVLTSVPPLPSEDIISLLATGTTRNELVGEDAASMAATRAATLFIRNLRKSTDKADQPPSFLDLLEDRTELNMGRVNPETGEQTFGGKIRLWKQLFFVGDVDADSDYRALFKYVFRFR